MDSPSKIGYAQTNTEIWYQFYSTDTTNYKQTLNEVSRIGHKNNERLNTMKSIKTNKVKLNLIDVGNQKKKGF